MSAPTTKAEARKIRYGVWGGCPNGTPYDESRCAAEVHPNDRFPATHQCFRKSGHGPGGLYCKQHDPDAIKRRQKAAQDKFDEELRRRAESHSDRVVGAALREYDAALYASLLNKTEALT